MSVLVPCLFQTMVSAKQRLLCEKFTNQSNTLVLYYHILWTSQSRAVIHCFCFALLLHKKSKDIFFWMLLPMVTADMLRVGGKVLTFHLLPRHDLSCLCIRCSGTEPTLSASDSSSPTTATTTEKLKLIFFLGEGDELLSSCPSQRHYWKLWLTMAKVHYIPAKCVWHLLVLRSY